MPLSNSQFDELKREYDEKQNQNQLILSNRRKDLFMRIPRLQEIEATISSLSVSTVEKMLSGDSGALDKLKSDIEILKSERISILTGLGLPEDYLTVPPYDCKDCKDTGYIGNERCHCFKQKAIDIVYNQSNLKALIETNNFENFTYDYYSKDEINPATQMSVYDTMHDIVSQAWDFIRNFDRSFDNLFLYGDTGLGKTYLSCCIAKELLDTSHSVVYLTAFQLFDIFRKANFSKDSVSAMQGDNILSCDLLIIDDLGTEVGNSFTNSQLFLCLNERILNRKSTIISTNLSLSVFSESYSERVFSRVSSCYKMWKLTGKDIRIQSKINKNLSYQ